MGIIKAIYDDSINAVAMPELPKPIPHTQIVTVGGTYAVAEPYEDIVAEIGEVMGTYRFNETFLEYTSLNNSGYFIDGSFGGNGKPILIKLDQILAVIDKSV